MNKHTVFAKWVANNKIAVEGRSWDDAIFETTQDLLTMDLPLVEIDALEAEYRRRNVGQLS